MFAIRLASNTDIPPLQKLIAASVRGLSEGYYSAKQIESSIKYIFGIDTQLLIDGTYYVIEANNTIAACGGWSKRKTLYGGDQHKSTTDPLLNPNTDAARIRAFFVDPAWARQGIGKMLIKHCENEAMNNGFTAMELGATLPGEPLYKAMGYNSILNVIVDMPDGEKFEVIKMRKELIPK